MCGSVAKPTPRSLGLPMGHQFANPVNESGKGAQIPPYKTIPVECWVTGLAVSDRDTYYYLIASGTYRGLYAVPPTRSTTTGVQQVP